MKNEHIRHIMSRLALALVFIIFGIWEVLQPTYWNSFVPPAFSSFINVNLFVQMHGLLILAIGIAVLIGAYLRISAILASITTLAVIIFLMMASGFTDLLVRDLVILLVSVSLVFDDTDYLRARK